MGWVHVGSLGCLDPHRISQDASVSESDLNPGPAQNAQNGDPDPVPKEDAGLSEYTQIGKVNLLTILQVRLLE